MKLKDVPLNQKPKFLDSISGSPLAGRLGNIGSVQTNSIPVVKKYNIDFQLLQVGAGAEGSQTFKHKLGYVPYPVAFFEFVNFGSENDVFYIPYSNDNVSQVFTIETLNKQEIKLTITYASLDVGSGVTVKGKLYLLKV